MTTVVDGEKLVLGRLASTVAEMAKDGDDVEIVNAEKIALTGDRDDVFQRYKEKYDRGDKDHGPHFPKRPDRIFKRTVRGMLPHRKSHGREAHKRVKAYVGIPRELESEEKRSFEDARLQSRRYVTLGEVSEYLGSNF